MIASEWLERQSDFVLKSLVVRAVELGRDQVQTLSCGGRVHLAGFEGCKDLLDVEVWATSGTRGWVKWTWPCNILPKSNLMAPYFLSRIKALATARSSPSDGLFTTPSPTHIVAEPPPSRFIASRQPRLTR